MLDDRPYMRESAGVGRWPVSIVLVIANAVCYALQLVAGLPFARPLARLVDHLALWPDGLAHGELWQLLSFQFLHAGPLHLIINSAMLYLFGRPVEDALGRTAFLRLYFGSGAAGGLLQVVCGWLFPQHFGLGPVVGASAGVFGLIAAFAALNWEQSITMLVAFILPVTMRAKYLILVEVVIASLGLLEPRSGIAHGAHLGGILAALGYIQFSVKAQRRLFDWSRFRAAPRRRELVSAPAAPKRTAWQRRQTSVPEDLPPAEFISREVDPILDKISAHGIQSLTERERRILETARAKVTTHRSRRPGA